MPLNILLKNMRVEVFGLVVRKEIKLMKAR